MTQERSALGWGFPRWALSMQPGALVQTDSVHPDLRLVRLVVACVDSSGSEKYSTVFCSVTLQGVSVVLTYLWLLLFPPFSPKTPVSS